MSANKRSVRPISNNSDAYLQLSEAYLSSSRTVVPLSEMFFLSPPAALFFLSPPVTLFCLAAEIAISLSPGAGIPSGIPGKRVRADRP